MSAISVKDLSVKFGEHKILKNLSFEVTPGDVVAVVGPNGAGKTTLIKALMGLTDYNGTATVLGMPARHLGMASHKIGYVPQVLDFDRTMPITVRELLDIHAHIKDEENEHTIYNMLGIHHLLDKRLGVLSGGEFQRILLAMTLINKPEVLFLDEPTAGIDVEGSGEIYGFIQKLREKDSMTIMIVSHDLDVVLRNTDQVLCINRSLVCQGTPATAITPKTIEQLYGKHYTAFEHNKESALS